MAFWPFASVTQPNIDTGLVAAPASATDIDTTNPIGLISVLVVNPTAALLTYSLTNTAGTAILPAVDVAANSQFYAVYVGLKCAGLKSSASGSGLFHQIAGLK